MHSHPLLDLVYIQQWLVILLYDSNPDVPGCSVAAVATAVSPATF